MELSELKEMFGKPNPFRMSPELSNAMRDFQTKFNGFPKMGRGMTRAEFHAAILESVKTGKLHERLIVTYPNSPDTID